MAPNASAARDDGAGVARDPARRPAPRPGLCPGKRARASTSGGRTSAITPWRGLGGRRSSETASSVTTTRALPCSLPTWRSTSAGHALAASTTASMPRPTRSASSSRWNVSATQHPSLVSAARARRARRTSFSRGLCGLVISDYRQRWLLKGLESISYDETVACHRGRWSLACRWPATWSLLSRHIESAVSLDEARPADMIVVLGAAEYRGRPSRC